MSESDKAITTIASVPGAFAQAGRQSRTEGELFERCRRVIASRLGSDLVWITVRGGGRPDLVIGSSPLGEPVTELARLTTGETEIIVTTAPEIAERARPSAYQLSFGLAVVSELRSVLVDRQASLDDAVFQLRALRQV